MRTWITCLVSLVLMFTVVACNSSNPSPAPSATQAATQSGFPAVETPTPSMIAPPTFTPGPATVSKNRLLYVRSGRLMTANADGSDKRPLLGDKAPEIYAAPRDPGRAWSSPSGKQIAFFGNPDGALWVVGADGSNLRRVTDGLLPPEGVGTDRDREAVIRSLTSQEIAWSPDEARVAVLGAPKGAVDLYTVDLPAGRVTQVTNDQLREGRFSWSPDGTRVIYAAADEGFNNERLFTAGADGSSPVEVPREPILTAAGMAADTAIPGFLNPTWLDANRVFFYPVGTKGSLGIWSYDLASRATKPITTFPIATPDWSPVTQRWVMGKQGEAGSIFTLGLDGGEPKQIIAQNAFAPIWTPDGKRIVYSAGSEGSADKWDIRVVDADGANEQTLAKDFKLISFEPPEPGPAGKRVWSKDQSQLLFTAAGASYGSPGPDLENWWAVPLAGGEARKLTDLEQVFYLQRLLPSPDNQSYGSIGLTYMDRSLHIWTFGTAGGNVTAIDGPARWFIWVP